MRKVYLIILGLSLFLSHGWAGNNKTLIPLRWTSKADSLQICEMKRQARLLQMGEQVKQNTCQNSDLFYEASKGWNITVLDSAVGSEVQGTSLALDSQDNPHIVYEVAGNKLEYTFYDTNNSKWGYEWLGGANQSLAVDSADYPHIACFFNGLGYLVKSDSGWDTIQPYPGPWVDWTSIALDSKGRPHIGWAWWAWSNAEMILYTYWNDTIWKTDTVDIAMCYPGGAIAEVSLALDTMDSPHLVYVGNACGAGIKYARKTVKGWAVETVDTTTPDSTIYGDAWLSLKVDKFNIPCVVYAGVAHLVKGEKYARRETTGWETEIIDTTAWSENSLCIDNNNNPHISCRRRYSDGYWLQYAWKDTNSWQINIVDSMIMTTPNLSYTSISIDKDNYAHISYRGVVNNYAAGKYAKGIGVGIEEKSTVNSQQLPMTPYPNPFVNTTIIRLSDSKIERLKDCEIKVYNMAGRLVEGTDNNIIGKDLKSGIYFVEVKGYKLTKIIKLGGVK